MFSLNCKGRLLVVDKPLVMGILNITPDSFYSGSRVRGVDEVLFTAEKMLRDGATILDIGGQSTRPGSEKLEAETELSRVIAPIEALHRRFPEAIISIDTYYASVAREAVNAGASLVNDISAGQLDPQMIPVVAGLGVPYVLMHMKGNPQTMQQQAVYANVTREVLDQLALSMQQIKEAGIRDIIIDPGFGFGKTSEHNFSLLRELPVFSLLKAPLLLGISRKSFIWKTLGVTSDSSAALQGTTALHMAGLMNGASILRVHDVRDAADTIRLFHEMQAAGK
jgi:dihydropteroate synthase